MEFGLVSLILHGLPQQFQHLLRDHLALHRNCDTDTVLMHGHFCFRADFQEVFIVPQGKILFFMPSPECEGSERVSLMRGVSRFPFQTAEDGMIHTPV